MTSRYVFQTEFFSGSVAFLLFLMLKKKEFQSSESPPLTNYLNIQPSFLIIEKFTKILTPGNRKPPPF